MLYTTTIHALCPHTRNIKKYCGPNVQGESYEDAQKYCDTHYLGFCEVDGVLISEIPTEGESNYPMWHKQVNYDNDATNNIKNEIVKILYTHSTDDSECMRIRFEDIDKVIDKILTQIVW